MTPTATYIAEENCLQELPRMEKPDSKDYTKVVHRPFGEIDCFTDNKYYEDLKQYNAHLATLRKIPCDPSCKGLWADGQKAVERKDYEVKKRCSPQKYCNVNGCDYCVDTAFPLVPVKSEPDMPNLILTAFQNEPVNFLLSNALRHLTQDQQRELCNALQERLPVPASIEDEAKRLYPYSGSLLQNDTLENRFAEVKRRVHITCARQYMDTIEKLRAENNKMRKALEEIAQKYADAEVIDDIGQFVFEMGELATEALK